MEHLRDLPLAPYTSYRVGGPADHAVFPADVDQLVQVVRAARRSGLPWMVLGGGSNVLVSDRGVRGLVILTVRMTRLTVAGARIVAEAGASSHQVALAARDAGLSGVEFLTCLPGSIGGACVMNARAFGGEISQVLRRARVVTRGGQLRERQLRGDQFGYKRSPFQRSGGIVAEVTLQLSRGRRDRIAHRMADNEAHRRANHEMDFPSCGCVFKNDRRIGIPSGKLIDSCGLKGFTIGAAQVSPHHANFVINRGGATAADVRRVIEHVRDTVTRKTGHLLQLEVRVVGEW